MNSKLQSILQAQQDALAASADAPPTQEAAPAPPEQVSSYGLSELAGGTEHFLDFHFPDGDRVALPYANLNLVSTEWEAGRLSLDFGTHLVTLHGASLSPELHDLILDRGVRWISAPWPEQAPVDGRPWVDEIEIVALEEADFDDDGAENFTEEPSADPLT